MSNSDDKWREAGPEIVDAFLKNGMVHIENFRLIKSPACTEKTRPHSRGKGKKRKPWER